MKSETDLTTEELEEKYNSSGDGEHPVFTRSLWRKAIADEITNCHYWNWLVCQVSLKD